MPEPDTTAAPAADAAPAPERPKQAGGAITGLAVVGASILTQLLSTVNAVLASRMLGVEGRGQVVLVTSLAMMASQLTLGGGLPNAITKLLADKGYTARDGLGHLLPRLVTISVVPSALAAGYLLFLERHSDGGTKYALAVALALMALQTMGLRVLIGSMLGEGTPLLSFAMTNLAPQAVTTLAFVVAFGVGADLDAVETLALIIGSALLTSLVRLLALRKPTHDPTHRLDGHELWDLTKKTHIGSVGPIDGLSIDRTLVGSLLGNAQLGLYSAAFSLASLTNILGGSLAMVALPRIAVVQNDPPRERLVVRGWIVLSAAIIVVAVVGLELIAAPTIRIAFGEEFTGATECARWLIAAGGLLSFRRVLIAILQGRGHGGWASWIEVALTPFVVLGVWWASHINSLVAAGITMAAVGVISCLTLWVGAYRSRPGGGHHGDEPTDETALETPVTT
ncbi:lipopolysaccharide biosynthesis protein [Nocardioides marmorisolisilvae]|uniref:lipopolysaccharide biosynthesis protein n=1 Tax=Nocardioides marmorisolisilvae TaxID=1542737 RepID=UPI0016163372|nr:lipopolysaccharide biosynthesis protein [Nocardioides marmorisolisilvae]